VDPTKSIVIINLEALRNVKQLCTTLGHTRYYRKLLKKDTTFRWNEEFQQSLDVLKEKMVTAHSRQSFCRHYPLPNCRNDSRRIH